MSSFFLEEFRLKSRRYFLEGISPLLCGTACVVYCSSLKIVKSGLSINAMD